ncbi:uncharacterized protein LOC134286322 [Aedes albopictus]|uniref:Secreted protein n=1 Tax=Aedes albopictus TaxID=7160 RepID=A0ABM2A5I1_AEDAL
MKKEFRKPAEQRSKITNQDQNVKRFPPIPVPQHCGRQTAEPLAWSELERRFQLASLLLGAPTGKGRCHPLPELRCWLRFSSILRQSKSTSSTTRFFTAGAEVPAGTVTP